MLEAFTVGDLQAAAACFTADATYREARRPAIAGRDAIAAHFARFASDGGPWRFAADDVIGAGERVCVVYRFAVPGGEGEPWRERAGCAIVHFGERGLIAEWREYEG